MADTAYSSTAQFWQTVPLYRAPLPTVLTAGQRKPVPHQAAQNVTKPLPPSQLQPGNPSIRPAVVASSQQQTAPKPRSYSLFGAPPALYFKFEIGVSSGPYSMHKKSITYTTKPFAQSKVRKVVPKFLTSEDKRGRPQTAHALPAPRARSEVQIRPTGYGLPLTVPNQNVQFILPPNQPPVRVSLAPQIPPFQFERPQPHFVPQPPTTQRQVSTPYQAYQPRAQPPPQHIQQSKPLPIPQRPGLSLLNSSQTIYSTSAPTIPDKSSLRKPLPPPKDITHQVSNEQQGVSQNQRRLPWDSPIVPATDGWGNDRDSQSTLSNELRDETKAHRQPDYFGSVVPQQAELPRPLRASTEERERAISPESPYRPEIAAQRVRQGSMMLSPESIHSVRSESSLTDYEVDPVKRAKQTAQEIDEDDEESEESDEDEEAVGAKWGEDKEDPILRRELASLQAAMMSFDALENMNGHLLPSPDWDSLAEIAHLPSPPRSLGWAVARPSLNTVVMAPPAVPGPLAGVQPPAHYQLPAAPFAAPQRQASMPTTVNEIVSTPYSPVAPNPWQGYTQQSSAQSVPLVNRRRSWTGVRPQVTVVQTQGPVAGTATLAGWRENLVVYR